MDFIEIILGILRKVKQIDGYYYRKDQTVDIYEKREKIRGLSTSFDFNTLFQNFTQNIIITSIMHRFNFEEYHSLKKRFNEFIHDFQTEKLNTQAFRLFVNEQYALLHKEIAIHKLDQPLAEDFTDVIDCFKVIVFEVSHIMRSCRSWAMIFEELSPASGAI